MTGRRPMLDRLARGLAKLRGRSIDELRERVAQRVSAELERRGLSSAVGEPSDRELQAMLDPEAVGTPSHFFDALRDGRAAAELRSPRWASARAALLAKADRIVAGRYDLLGHDGLSFGDPVDWHLDPVSGRRGPRVHWSRIPYLDAEKIGDHKVIWELNRHQHFMVLGRAYQVSADPRYADHFAEQLTSWMNDNPPKHGVNWASSLEVSYRAIAWLWSLELFREAPVLTPALRTRAVKFLSRHGRHLERYLSTYFSPNTHLTGEALGLLYLGVLLPELRDASRWRDLGWSILERELPRQVHDDGVYFEHASYYHRYTVDIYLHAVLLARRTGIPIPAPMLQRLALAVDHLADLTRPDGAIPLIGDDDGGVLVSLEERRPADVRAALGIASVVLERPDWAAVAGQVTEEVVWMLGPDEANRARASAISGSPTHLSRIYRDGGYAVMRSDWGSRAHHLVVDAGPLGAMNCGHAHSDALSFELTVFGCPALVDTGTYTYTGSREDRDAFRHSAAHNTLTLDGNSASVPNGPFSWAAAAAARVERWWSGPATDYFVGSHDGFLRLPEPAVHRRRILFARSGFLAVIDAILAEGSHEVEAHFHGAIGSRVTRLDEASASLDLPCTEGSARLLLFALGDVSAVHWEEGWVSPVYGSRSLAPRARVASRGTGRRYLITLLVPTLGLDRVVVRETPCHGGRAAVIDRPDHGQTNLLLVGTGEAARVGAIEMEGELALIQRDSTGELRTVALFGDSAHLVADGIIFEATGTAEFTRAGAGWAVDGEGRVLVEPAP
jgi:Uncharacterized protein conserved in bacteria